jgi:hypothetical protein
MGDLFAAYLNDLHPFDPSTLTWTDLSEVLGPDSNPQPTARYLPMPRFETQLFAVPRQKAALVALTALPMLGRSLSGLTADGDTLFLYGGVSVDGLNLPIPPPTLNLIVLSPWCPPFSSLPSAPMPPSPPFSFCLFFIDGVFINVNKVSRITLCAKRNALKGWRGPMLSRWRRGSMHIGRA